MASREIGDRSSNDKVRRPRTAAQLRRCPWPGDDQLMITYHDTEWGNPLHDDQRLFEFMVLDAAQAGLSWATVLRKRENFRRAFAGFDPVKIARFTEGDSRRLMADPGIIRNRLKIASAITNARQFLEVQSEFGTFDRYIWDLVGGHTIKNRRRSLKQIPPQTKESEAMSRDLRQRGFTFVGPTICYSFMQAAGLVNDHLVTCFRFDQV